MIGDTKADLTEHLSNIDDKLRNGPQDQLDPEWIIHESDIKAERDCTMRCLEVCAQVTTFIEGRQQNLGVYVSNYESEPGSSNVERTSLDTKPRPSQQAFDETLRRCSTRLKSEHVLLSERLKRLNIRLSSTSEDDDKSPARNQMKQEAETIRQCLDVCEQEAEAANNARVNIIEDVTSAEDSNAVIVSTVGDLIAAHRITAGARSNMTIGQMSDETVQHISTTYVSRLADLAKPPVQERAVRDLPLSGGRTLGESKVRTL